MNCTKVCCGSGNYKYILYNVGSISVIKKISVDIILNENIQDNLLLFYQDQLLKKWEF